jgi:hypothetical protein
MRRLVVKSIVLVAGVLVLCAILGPFDSIADVRVVGPKVEHLRARGDEYSVLFFGSSYVHRDFAPEVFDAEMARRGIPVRSFNVGVPGMDPPETYFLVNEILPGRASHLMTVLVELDYYRTAAHERDLHTRRNDYWHDAYFTAQAVRATLEETSDPRFRAKTAARHVDAFARHVTHAGRGLYMLPSAIGFAPDAEARHVALGPRGDGFFALDDETSMRVRIRRELFSGLEVDVLAEKVARLESGSARDEESDRTQTTTQIAALAEVVRRIRSVGARPVLVVPPCLDGRAPLIEMAKANIDADVLVFNDPRRYPSLYAAANRFDVGHLNKSGATEFSSLLAEALASVLASPESAYSSVRHSALSQERNADVP